MKLTISRAPFQHLSRRSVNVFAEFTKSIKRQIAENKEFQKNVQMLSDETTRLKESDAMQLAKDAAQSTSKIAKTVEAAVSATLETPVVKGTGKILYTAGKAVADTGAKVAEPILETQAAKAVASGVTSVKKEIIDSSSSAFYAEYRPKEIRDMERLERTQKIQAEQIRALSGSSTGSLHGRLSAGPVQADKDAGEAVVLHRSSRLSNAWSSFKESSPVAQKLFSVKRGFEESDHPILERVRDFLARTRFEETEEARVIRAIREVDPGFRKDSFLKEMTLYTIPDILEVVLREDAKALKDWCSERALAKLQAGFEASKAQGLISDSKLLDIQNVDIRQFTLLEDELPIILIGFSTHEILVYKDKTGKVVLGTEDAIQKANYVIAFTKDQLLNPEAPINPKTNGWLVIDWNRGSATF